MNGSLMVVLSVIDIALDLFVAVGVVAVICGWRLSARAQAVIGEPESGRVKPAPTHFTVVRVGEGGDEVARFVEDATGAAKRVIGERRAGYSGHLLLDGRVARSWVNGEDVV